MTTSNLPAIIAPYRRYLEADSECGRTDAQHVLVSHEMLTLCPVDLELQQNFTASFGKWLQGWEGRLGGSSG
jgi:hypothetical protein